MCFANWLNAAQDSQQDVRGSIDVFPLSCSRRILRRARISFEGYAARGIDSDDSAFSCVELWEGRMIPEKVAQYPILQKSDEGGMSFACPHESNKVGRRNGPRTSFVSGCRFEDPTQPSKVAGVAW